ncbi:hypothetical protein G6F28_007999 [Rhizopus arrhizus]|nr:hypothetical protein G6F28_007999 [Rhizopus arrhizus]KAG1406506.1 hypothetical protein G6F59_012403 [Rhizopus arrhizus]
MALATFRHPTQIQDPQILARVEQDRAWLEEHVADFGPLWTVDEEDEAQEHDLLKLIQDDQIKGRLGIPPFWMLSSTTTLP